MSEFFAFRLTLPVFYALSVAAITVSGGAASVLAGDDRAAAGSETRSAGDFQPVPFTVEQSVVLEHDDGKFLWFHPRTVAVPTGLLRASEGGKPPEVWMTLQKHLRTSDHYSGLSLMRSEDLGKTWTGPTAQPELDWVHESDEVDIAVCDVTPGWHPQTRKILAVGAQVRYSRGGAQLNDVPRAHQTAYAVIDPATGRCTKWQRLQLPADDLFEVARSACAQFLVEPDGSVLLPFYVAPHPDRPHSVTVVRCRFDGTKLTYQEHGNVLKLDDVRGLVEPSLARFGGRFWLTIRHDLKGYVAVSDDGLRFGPAEPWRFEDGTEPGSYNTQQHWLTHSDGLFLCYTRRGLKNDHITRHRAPLVIAQVNPETRRIVRSTEQILVPERGATLGNFGAAAITPREAWVTVSEGIWDDAARQRGATGALWLARVRWSRPDTTRPAPSSEE